MLYLDSNLVYTQIFEDFQLIPVEFNISLLLS